MKKVLIAIIIILNCFLAITVKQSVLAAGEHQASGTTTPTSTQGAPTGSYTPSITPLATPTTTLVPLPAVTLIFPKITATRPPTVIPAPLPATETPPSAGEAAIITLSPRLRLLVILIIFLWIFLAGFAVVYIWLLK
jgi:hypothetical protein